MGTKTITKKIAKPKPTKAELRVQVAKDVLKHLAQSKIAARSGHYLRLHQAPCNAIEIGDDLRRILKRPDVACTVCALGALFVAEVIRRDDFAVIATNHGESPGIIKGAAGGSYTMRERLDRVFPRKHLLQVERAFEGDECPGNVLGDLGYIDINNDWKVEWPNPHERLEAIMRSIIRNGGTFRPKLSKADRNPHPKGGCHEGDDE